VVLLHQQHRGDASVAHQFCRLTDGHRGRQGNGLALDQGANGGGQQIDRRVLGARARVARIRVQVGSWRQRKKRVELGRLGASVAQVIGLQKENLGGRCSHRLPRHVRLCRRDARTKPIGGSQANAPTQVRVLQVHLAAHNQGQTVVQVLLSHHQTSGGKGDQLGLVG